MASYSLNNVAAPDSYLQPGQTAQNTSGTLCGPGTLGPLPLLDHANLAVANSAIYYSLMLTNELADPKYGAWQPETFLLPGYLVLQRPGLVGVRVRAANPGQLAPARVTVECVDST